DDDRRGEAAAGKLAEPFHSAAERDRRYCVRAGGRLAGIDTARRDELGFLPLRDLVQSRSEFHLFRPVAGTPSTGAGAGAGRVAGTWRCLCRAPALRTALPGRPT